ncbi:hypothetical protein EJV47_24170 [Hymenobacter gummosus]|uniref:Uncharacterized protein n=1 Tax=Hymenobacter gummosus TaxID=1776032 RepID=A0A3S0K1B5_9BACT|nr:DUF5691 domain-containing protein [Hymenobacter gummosus]RTQ45593.1 hypothetical protein EJV47_24170 [Hymenobacter gummosus]
MTDPTAWPQLLRLALLGTRQGSGPVPALPELPAPPDAPAEAQLLHAAGALGLMRKAGYLAPTVTAAAPAPAGPETLPALGKTGTDALRQLLDGQYPELLPGYLQALARHGRRVPHRLLVALLELAATRPELREPAAAVLGTRGAWLAALNPAWTALLAASAADAASWDTGTPAQRRDYLAALLRRDPARARELLAAALPQEPARNQAVLLAALQQPNPADEALLTPYLASKSKEVRRAVVPLLARLPCSALAERLWQRAQPYLNLKTPLLGADKLEVTLPEAWDAGWLADGIEQKDARYTGEKAAWLGQLLALVPPQRWAAHWQVGPDKLLQLAAAGEWSDLLLGAWREALHLHRAADWALAYLGLQLANPKVVLLPAEVVTELLPPTEVHALLLRELPNQPRLGQPEAAWEPLLLTAPGPWPAALTERALRLIENTLTVSGTAPRYSLHYRLQALLRHMQGAVPPEQYARCAEVLNALREVEPSLNYAFNHLLDALQFREQLAGTFTEPPAPDGG